MGIEKESISLHFSKNLRYYPKLIIAGTEGEFELALKMIFNNVYEGTLRVHGKMDLKDKIKNMNFISQYNLHQVQNTF